MGSKRKLRVNRKMLNEERGEKDKCNKLCVFRVIILAMQNSNYLEYKKSIYFLIFFMNHHENSWLILVQALLCTSLRNYLQTKISKYFILLFMGLKIL